MEQEAPTAEKQPKNELRHRTLPVGTKLFSAPLGSETCNYLGVVEEKPWEVAYVQKHVPDKYNKKLASAQVELKSPVGWLPRHPWVHKYQDGQGNWHFVRDQEEKQL